ncbi:mycothiol conjugate amidase Mca [Microbacterium sp. STN6]|uniref:mycothiol conjugate amidase Mca n=1 Tax=Microbacterium sp. STN6 TaxID=2995588 RepID=UPI002260C84B|nr:mycothiol conjugate amidase Mca [Microbacterium sp. STN6]MCX7521862.1 mycothiol conjugate amidase Mca [Microbacterium sp. STN6]
MAVHAHPDDESSKGAATYAYYRSRGAEVMVVTCTGGERGDVLNEGLAERAMAERDLPGLRRREMAAAQAVMGIEQRWLGYMDSGMPRDDGTVPAGSFAAIPVEISAEPLVRLVRSFRPHVMVTYDENGGYPHPDHIRSHVVGVEAYRAAADPERYPEQGPAWQVSKLYYDQILNPKRMLSVYEALKRAEPESSLLSRLEEMKGWMAERPFLGTSQVPVGDHLDARDAALRSHASQVAPDSPFFFWPNRVQREAWPYEDYQLIDSKVETRMPETDLFAGIEADA